ncbi:MAG TPA: hypothetical protein VFY83_00645 [Anaerolineales bacterium]|nr:hypothetical protein [Anaerolineales bacterium]
MGKMVTGWTDTEPEKEGWYATLRSVGRKEISVGALYWNGTTWLKHGGKSDDSVIARMPVRFENYKEAAEKARENHQEFSINW